LNQNQMLSRHLEAVVDHAGALKSVRLGMNQACRGKHNVEQSRDDDQREAHQRRPKLPWASAVLSARQAQRSSIAVMAGAR
jgi:hypothetical protein